MSKPFHKTTVIHGDCLAEMDTLIEEGVKVDMVLADLPYAVTNNIWDKDIIPFGELWPRYWGIAKENAALVFTARQPFTSRLIMSFVEQFRFTMVWRKNLKSGNLNARRRPMVSFEDIVVFYRKQPTYNPIKIPRTFQQKAGNTKNSKTKNYGKQRENYIDRQSDSLMPDDVIDEEDSFYYDEIEDMAANPPMLHFKAKHNAKGKRHPTEKPVELMQWLIRTFSNEGDIILSLIHI